ncbi:hypothetical protein CCP2SC5_600008 [Azospirillaceae bacterium]
MNNVESMLLKKLIEAMDIFYGLKECRFEFRESIVFLRELSESSVRIGVGCVVKTKNKAMSL